MNLKLTLASNNQGKLKELKEMSEECDWLSLSLAPDGFDPEEYGSTYLENAVIKAAEAAKLSGEMAVGDDSGLEVDALEGRPGLKSARYCQGSESLGRKKLLGELQGIDGGRDARFVCAMAVCEPDKKEPVFTTLKIWKGRIGFSEKGEGGFGFDPIFYPDNHDVTAAQLSSKEKNLLSHRGQAWRETLKFLEKNFIRP